MENQAKGILEMARGAFLERADYEMKRVVENILDPNTKATAKRKITMTLTLTPDDRRENLTTSFEAKSMLAPTSPVVTALYVAGEDSHGIPQIVEMTPQIPGQMSLDGSEQEHPAILEYRWHRMEMYLSIENSRTGECR